TWNWKHEKPHAVWVLRWRVFSLSKSLSTATFSNNSRFVRLCHSPERMGSARRMKIHLRAFEKEDIDSIIKLVNDETVTQYLSDTLIYPISRADEVKWLESVSMTNHREKVFAIETLNEELIGSVGLHNINWVERKAELGIMIGEKEFWGKGYGSEAVRE